MRVKLDFTAIFFGLLAYVLFVLIHDWLLYSNKVDMILPMFGSPHVWIVYGMPLYGILNSIVPGYLAGWLAKNSGVIHGGIVAVLGAILAPAITISLYGNDYILGVFRGITEYGVLCAFSGGLAELHHRHKNL